MNIAFAHFRVGETDGVSLEMDKWIKVLKGLGHNCCYIAGGKGLSAEKTFVVSEMYYKNARNQQIVDCAYRGLGGFKDEAHLVSEIFSYANSMEEAIERIIINNNIDVVVPNNIWSLGWNLSCGIAFTRLAQKHKNVRFIAHNHDFYWERELYSHPKYAVISQLLEEYFVPVLPNVSHCVINSLAQAEVQRRRGAGSVVVPNVFDFEAEGWAKDEYNSSLASIIKASPSDVVVLQATRIGERKAIEFGIEVVNEIKKILPSLAGKQNYRGQIITDKSKPVYVLCGMEESVDGSYFDALKQRMHSYGIEFRYINNVVRHSRGRENNAPIYSLWDVYVYADLITYTSVLEGWGNQLLEAMFAKKPVVIYEYPVYKADLKQSGLQLVSVGDEYVPTSPLLSLPKNKAQAAAVRLLDIFTNPQKYCQITNNNFEVGAKLYSYSALQKILQNVFRREDTP